MARGKKTDKQLAEQVVSEYLMCGNVMEAARRCEMPDTTAYDIVHKYMDDKQFGQARKEKMQDLSLGILHAMESKMPDASFKELATAYGIITDKSVLLDGGATQRIEVSGVETDKLAELAGYVKR